MLKLTFTYFQITFLPQRLGINFLASIETQVWESFTCCDNRNQPQNVRSSSSVATKGWGMFIGSFTITINIKVLQAVNDALFTTLFHTTFLWLLKSMLYFISILTKLLLRNLNFDTGFCQITMHLFSVHQRQVCSFDTFYAHFDTIVRFIASKVSFYVFVSFWLC